MSLVFIGLSAVSALAAEDPIKISIEKLKTMLDNPDLLILDVRLSQHWQKSEFKIKGAVRRRANLFDSWVNDFSHDKVVVLYCA